MTKTTEEDLEEGKLRTRFHKVRERNTKTVKKKKEDFLKKNGMKMENLPFKETL